MPFLKLSCVPGGKYHIKTADLIRAIPMVTSPFMRAKQHIDIWFVPYNVLWSRFNEFMVDKDEKLSSALKDRDYVPHVHLKELLDAIEACSSDTDIVGQDFRKGAYRLLDALGYPSFKYYFGNGMTEEEEDKAVNLWPILAYNYIWYTMYRQQYYDSGDHLLGNTGYHTHLYNADYLQCDTADSADVIRANTGFTQYVPYMCQMRYRTWKKDLFTGLLPSTQFGNISSVDAGSSLAILNQVEGNCDKNGDTNAGTADPDTFGLYINTASDTGKWQRKVSDQWVAPDSSSIPNVQTWSDGTLNDGTSDLRHSHVVKVVDALSVSTSTSGVASFDVLALRKAEAVQIWRENALRAGNFLEDNFNAHYGTKPKSHMHLHPTLVGSIDAPLNIGDIDSHAQINSSGANQQLADVAGKGISSLGKGSFNFQASEFGIILGVVSMLPETEYLSTGIDRDNQLLEREDYFVPEYSRLGLQAVDSSNFYFGGTRSVNIGYAPRDYGYKQKMDKVHLDFFNTTNELGVFRTWVSPKYDVFDAIETIATSSGSYAMPLSCLYVNPELFDVNFSVGTSVSRQFMVNYFFDVDGIQPMPVTGMPSY